MLNALALPTGTGGLGRGRELGANLNLNLLTTLNMNKNINISTTANDNNALVSASSSSGTASPTKTTTIPAFLSKLWSLVEDEETNDLICWGNGGVSFIIKHQAQFSRELLPAYYKHNNMPSFIRQLNMYGFHKVLSNGLPSGILKTNDCDEVEFAHPFFVRGLKGSMGFIKRKASNANTGVKQDNLTNAVESESLNKMISEVSEIKGRQNEMNRKIGEMKRENEGLWRELTNLRLKHNKQQKIVGKLIEFLINIIPPEARVVYNKRSKVPLFFDNRRGLLRDNKLVKNKNGQLVIPPSSLDVDLMQDMEVDVSQLIESGELDLSDLLYRQNIQNVNVNGGKVKVNEGGIGIEKRSQGDRAVSSSNSPSSSSVTPLNLSSMITFSAGEDEEDEDDNNDNDNFDDEDEAEVELELEESESSEGGWRMDEMEMQLISKRNHNKTLDILNEENTDLLLSIDPNSLNSVFNSNNNKTNGKNTANKGNSGKKRGNSLTMNKIVKNNSSNSNRNTELILSTASSSSSSAKSTTISIPTRSQSQNNRVQNKRRLELSTTPPNNNTNENNKLMIALQKNGNNSNLNSNERKQPNNKMLKTGLTINKRGISNKNNSNSPPATSALIRLNSEGGINLEDAGNDGLVEIEVECDPENNESEELQIANLNFNLNNRNGKKNKKEPRKKKEQNSNKEISRSSLGNHLGFVDSGLNNLKNMLKSEGEVDSNTLFGLFHDEKNNENEFMKTEREDSFGTDAGIFMESMPDYFKDLPLYNSQNLLFDLEEEGIGIE